MASGQLAYGMWCKSLKVATRGLLKIDPKGLWALVSTEAGCMLAECTVPMPPTQFTQGSLSRPPGSCGMQLGTFKPLTGCPYAGCH